MSRLIRLLVPCVLLAACSDSSASSDGSNTVPATTTAATAPASTDPTTTTVESTTTEATTTTVRQVERSVNFVAGGQQPTPLTFADERIGSITIWSDATGDLEGPLTSSVIVAEGVSITLTWFEGTVAECGTGGMLLRIGTRSDGSTGWEVVPGMGRGDLTSVVGDGIEVPPNFTGTLRCGPEPDVSQFATTIIEPPPAGGTAYEIATGEGGFPVTKSVAPNPEQAMAPTMTASEQVYPEGVLRIHEMVMPVSAQQPSMLNNSAVFIWLGAGPCGDGAVIRLAVDNLILPDFRGAWDLLAGANGGSHAGGDFGATATAGTAVCA